MKKTDATAVETRLATLRQKRGISASHLAAAAGVSRQTIYAMEAGSYVPNTAVALRLARALEATVEELFSLPEQAAPGELRTEDATLLAGGESPQKGQAVQLCRVDRRLVASAPYPAPWYLPVSDGVLTGREARREKARVQIFDPDQRFANRILIAGCDPGISVLARHVQAAGIELVAAHRNSSQALALLKQGWVHIAGTHLRDAATGESNLPAISGLFPKSRVAVISFAVWEQGLVTARHNPKSIRGVADLVRPDVTIVNREAGAGSRFLLDSQLKRLGIDARNIRGYDREAHGHLPAAWHVYSRLADCCVATRAAARVFGLGFVPLMSERYDLAIRKQHLDLLGIQALLDTLGRSSFRRELESAGGYDTSSAGRRIL